VRFIIFVRLKVNPSALLEWLHLETLGDCVLLWDSLVSLGGYRHLDGLVQRGSSSRGRWLSSAPIVVIVRGSWPFPSGEPKDTLMDCSWLVWSLSCIGYAAPDCRLGVWCLLACEPLSEWIATTGTNLPASKWTSVKNYCVILCLGFHWYSLWLIDIILWLVHSSTQRYNSLSLSCIYFPSLAKLFSVISFES
jgi:hypothetical protein